MHQEFVVVGAVAIVRGGMADMQEAVGNPRAVLTGFLGEDLDDRRV